jgi:16S rRNA (guanine527-N7)-methyltransferase
VTKSKRLTAFLDVARVRVLPIDDKKVRDLLDHDSLIREWMRTVSLVSKGDLDAGLDKHYLDSLLISEFIPDGAELVDLGSGAGFPGIPLAICRPDLRVHLVEVNEKKAYFLKEVRRRLDLSNVEVHLSSWEDLTLSADLAVARAAGNLDSLLGALSHLLKPGAELLLFSSTKDKDPPPKRTIPLENPLRRSKTFILFYSI